MEEIKPCIVVIGGGILSLGGDKALYRSDREGYYVLKEIKPRIVVIGGGILCLGGDKALYRSDRRRDTWRR